jgi:hypothetical protein
MVFWRPLYHLIPATGYNRWMLLCYAPFETRARQVSENNAGECTTVYTLRSIIREVYTRDFFSPQHYERYFSKLEFCHLILMSSQVTTSQDSMCCVLIRSSCSTVCRTTCAPKWSKCVHCCSIPPCKKTAYHIVYWSHCISHSQLHSHLRQDLPTSRREKSIKVRDISPLPKPKNKPAIETGRKANIWKLGSPY